MKREVVESIVWAFIVAVLLGVAIVVGSRNQHCIGGAAGKPSLNGRTENRTRSIGSSELPQILC